MDFGNALGRELGIDEAKIRDLPRWTDSDVYSPAERVALAYTDAMMATPTTVSDELRSQLLQHFSQRQIVELTHSIAIEDYRARFNRGLGVESDHYHTQ